MTPLALQTCPRVFATLRAFVADTMGFLGTGTHMERKLEPYQTLLFLAPRERLCLPYSSVALIRLAVARLTGLEEERNQAPGPALFPFLGVPAHPPTQQGPASSHKRTAQSSIRSRQSKYRQQQVYPRQELETPSFHRFSSQRWPFFEPSLFFKTVPKTKQTFPGMHSVICCNSWAVQTKSGLTSDTKPLLPSMF